MFVPELAIRKSVPEVDMVLVDRGRNYTVYWGQRDDMASVTVFWCHDTTSNCQVITIYRTGSNNRLGPY